MTKASIVCPSCSTDNDRTSEFCINCGTSLPQSSPQMQTEEEKRAREYQNWKKSAPYTAGAAIFLMFIDWMTGGTAWDWSLWAVVPILIFAVIAPFISFKL